MRDTDRGRAGRRRSAARAREAVSEPVDGFCTGTGGSRDYNGLEELVFHAKFFPESQPRLIWLLPFPPVRQQPCCVGQREYFFIYARYDSSDSCRGMRLFQSLYLLA